MKFIVSDTIPDIGEHINLLVKVYTKSSPQFYLGKFLLVDNDSVVFIPRFAGDEELSTKFYDRFKDLMDYFAETCRKEEDIDQLLVNLREKFDLDIYNDFTAEDVYTDYDIGSNYSDEISNIPIQLPSTDVEDNVDHDKELERMNYLVSYVLDEEVPENFFKISEKYLRKGFRKDAKNPLIPIKIYTKKGHYVTYYIRHTKLNTYTVKNTITNTGQWKYLFYTDEISQNLKKAPEHLVHFTKKGKYGSAGVMSGLRFTAEKFASKYAPEEKVISVRHSQNNDKVLKETITVGNKYRAEATIIFGDERTSRRSNYFKDVRFDLNEQVDDKRNRVSISGVYTHTVNPLNRRDREFNSFHIESIQGKLTFDMVNYFTTAHMRTHDMISVDINNMDIDNIKKFALAGYGFNKDSTVVFENNKRQLEQHLDDIDTISQSAKHEMKRILNRSKTFQEFILELLKTGKKDLVNQFYKSGLIEKYGKLSGSNRLLFRTNTLAGKVTKSEKILETFEILRDPANDYHLGHRNPKEIEQLLL